MAEVRDNILDQTRKTREKDILVDSSGGGGETLSNISEYSASFGYEDDEDFKQKDLVDKVVLDLGSGLGGLAKDSAAQKVMNCKVISVNPRLSLRGYRENEKSSSQIVVENTVPKASRLKQIFNKLTRKPHVDHKEIIQHAHDETAVASFAHALPFTDNSFDRVFDRMAISENASEHGHYESTDVANQVEKRLFETSLKEMMRVLRPEGKIMISDLFGYGNEKGWKEQVLKKLGYNYHVIWEDLQGRYWQLWPSGKRPIGIEIVKSN